MSYSSNLNNDDPIAEYFYQAQNQVIETQLNTGSRFIELNYFQSDNSPAYWFAVGTFGLGPSN